MTTSRFCHYELRTTDPAAARAFYEAVLGARGLDITRLPEQAAARGAPANWLGRIGVADPEAMAARLVALGGERLGPTRPAADGTPIVGLRDPLGSVVALGSPRPPGHEVIWHELHTVDRDRAWSIYGDLFGWRATASHELGPELGAYQSFAFADGEVDAGGMVNSARLPGVHPHWMYFFGVADLDAAARAVRAHGGRVLAGPRQVPGGERVAPCEDAQGAAFGLRQPVS